VYELDAARRYRGTAAAGADPGRSFDDAHAR
jgi:hypothetical protein